MNIVEKMVLKQLRGHRVIPHIVLRLMGVIVPKEVVFDGDDLGGARFVHGAVGTVLHPKTRIGKGVWIFQGVTVGKACPWNPDTDNEGCVIEDNAILCAGSKVLFKDSVTLIVGKGTIIAANAVLTQSTGCYEIWGGVPAKKIGTRK